MTTGIAVEANPTISEIRAPNTIRENKSRPKLSVPNGYTRLGGRDGTVIVIDRDAVIKGKQTAYRQTEQEDHKEQSGHGRRVGSKLHPHVAPAGHRRIAVLAYLRKQVDAEHQGKNITRHRSQNERKGKPGHPGRCRIRCNISGNEYKRDQLNDCNHQKQGHRRQECIRDIRLEQIQCRDRDDKQLG